MQSKQLTVNTGYFVSSMGGRPPKLPQHVNSTEKDHQFLGRSIAARHSNVARIFQ